MKENFYLAASTGAAFGLICSLILFFIDRSLLWLGSSAGVGFGVLLFLWLFATDRIVQGRYRRAEKQFSKDIRFFENANFHLGGKRRNGNLYLFDDALSILCLDEKPYLDISIPYEDIRTLKATKDWELLLGTDNQSITATAIDAETLSDQIQSFF